MHNEMRYEPRMTEPHERLLEARKRAGFTTARDAADRYGWKYPTYAGHENGQRGMTASVARSYAKSYGVDFEWLLYGGDAALPESPGGHIASEPELVPVYDIQASAGFGSLVEYEEHTHSLAFPPLFLKKLTSSNPSNLVIITVKGDSMEPTVLDDDVVLVDVSKRHIGYEGMFVLRHNDTLLIKRAGMAPRNGFVTLISDNEIYRPVEAEIKDITVVGKVLWYGRKV